MLFSSLDRFLLSIPDGTLVDIMPSRSYLLDVVYHSQVGEMDEVIRIRMRDGKLWLIPIL